MVKEVWNKGKKGLQVAWNKGQPMSEETKAKWKESMKKVLQDPNFKKKLSESHIGQVPWNKGKKIGKPSWNKGIPMSEEQKKKLSQSKIGQKYPPRTEEHRRKLGASHIGKPGTNLGKKFSEEHKNKIRAYTLKQYESGEFPKQTNTKPERQIKEELIKRGYQEGKDFIHQFKFMNKFMCDFCFPQQKVIVEVYGDYWHSNPKIFPTPTHPHQIRDMKRDKSKEAYITTIDNHAWDYVIIWEYDIKKDLSKCVDKIEEVLENKAAVISKL